MGDYFVGPSGGHADPAPQGLGSVVIRDSVLGGPFQLLVPQGEYVQEIILTYGDVIDSIEIKHGPYGGPTIDAPLRAGGRGARTNSLKVGMQHDDEDAVASISGRFGNLVESMIVEQTNGNRVTVAEPRPGSGWNDYKYQTPAGFHIVGFWGTVGLYYGHPVISSLGVIYRELP